MKIVIMVQRLTNGGAEHVAAMWAQGFCQKGHEVIVVIHDENAPVTYQLPPNVSLYNIVSHHKNKVLRTINRTWKLHSLLKKECPDIIIDVLNDYWKRIAMIGIGAFKVSTEHNTFERPANATEKFNKWRKIYLNRTYNHVTVLTQADKDVIGNKLKHVTVLPNPLAFEPIKKLDASKKEKVILAVGRLDAGHYKGFDVLIKAFGMANTDWSLQIAGAGKSAALEEYKLLAKECGVERKVEFLGFINEPASLYQRASIFVLSSRYEGFGLVLIEAMSQGCACIACDYKGRQREILLDDRNGLICATEDVEGLAHNIQLLIENDELRTSIQNNAIRRASDFCIPRITERWEVIFRERGLII